MCVDFTYPSASGTPADPTFTPSSQSGPKWPLFLWVAPLLAGHTSRLSGSVRMLRQWLGVFSQHFLTLAGEGFHIFFGSAG